MSNQREAPNLVALNGCCPNRIGVQPRPLERLPIVMTARDRAALLAELASRDCRACERTRHTLARKLWRASICAADAIPADVVAMNSRVVYRRDINEAKEECDLQIGNPTAPHPDKLSVLTILGSAVLGLRAGTVGTYETEEGARLTLVVERVTHQSEVCTRRAKLGKALRLISRNRVWRPDPDPDGAA